MMIVLAWIKDGKAGPVDVSAVAPNAGPSADFAANFALELNDTTARGYPMLLFLDEGKFIAPEPEFKDVTLQRALVDIFLGSDDAFQSDLAAIKDVNKTSEDGRVTLLHYAAETGDDGAMRALLARDADPDFAGSGGTKPLAWAVRARRLETVRTLLSLAAISGQRGPPPEELSRALGYGHLAVAVELLNARKGPASKAGINETMYMALYLGDEALVASLALRAGKNWASPLSPGSWAVGVRHGSPTLTGLLIAEGMKSDTLVADIPLLVTAAQAGSAESVRLLLESGAKVDRAARDGTTPLMAAVCAGDRATVELLLAAGADVGSKDRRRKTAMDRATVMQRADLMDLLRAQGAASPEAGDRLPAAPRLQPASEDCCCQYAGQPIVASTEVDVMPVAKVTPPPDLIWVRSATRDRPGVIVTGNPFSGEITERTASPASDRGTAVNQPRTDHSGVVTLVVEPDGRPSSVEIMAASPRGFEADLLKALQRYEFTPGMLNGQPVRTRMTMVILIPE